MTEKLRESLSAAMDDEADAFELRRVLDEAKQNDELREQWHRFHLVRDLLREEIKLYRPTLRESLWEELNQPVDDADTKAQLVLAEEVVGGGNKRSPWLGRLTGTAVAAVAAVLVIVNSDAFDTPPAGVDYAGGEQRVNSAELVPVMYQQATPLDRQRQNGLMLHHFQHRGLNQAGLTSFVKVATFRDMQPVTEVKETSEQVNTEEVSTP